MCSSDLMPLKNYEILSVFYKKQPIYNWIPTKKSTKGLLSNKNLGQTHTTNTTGESKLITSDNKKEYGYPKIDRKSVV